MKTLSSIFAGAALAVGVSASAAEPEAGYKNFNDFTARNNLTTSEQPFLNRTIGMGISARAESNPDNPMMGRIHYTIAHAKQAQWYTLTQDVSISSNGTATSVLSGTGRRMSGNQERDYYTSHFVPQAAGQRSISYDSPIGHYLQSSGLGIGGAKTTEGDFHVRLDKENRIYEMGSCAPLSPTMAVCTTSSYRDQQSQYGMKIDAFIANGQDISQSSYEYGRPFDGNEERSRFTQALTDRKPGITHSP